MNRSRIAGRDFRRPHASIAMNDTPSARTSFLVEDGVAVPATTRAAGRLDRWILNRMRQRLLGIPLRVTLWDGTSLPLADTQIGRAHV